MVCDPFEVVAEVAEVIPRDEWMLVGGLMVHCHAQLAGIVHQRPTNDTDIVVTMQTRTYAASAAVLEKIGFSLREPIDVAASIHRFVRGNDVVDLMIPDGYPSPTRFRQRAVVSVPGSKSALKRTVSYELANGAEIRIADLASALSLKGAAYFLPAANRERHLQDVVTLLACIGGEVIEPGLSKSMRKNIARVIGQLTHPEAWQLCSPADRAKAVYAASRLNPEWNPPDFVLPKQPRRLSP